MEARPKKKQFKCLLSSLYLAQFLTSIGHNRKTSHKMQGCIGLDGGVGEVTNSSLSVSFFRPTGLVAIMQFQLQLNWNNIFLFRFRSAAFDISLCSFFFPYPSSALPLPRSALQQSIFRQLLSAPAGECSRLAQPSLSLSLYVSLSLSLLVCICLCLSVSLSVSLSLCSCSFHRDILFTYYPSARLENALAWLTMSSTLQSWIAHTDTPTHRQTKHKCKECTDYNRPRTRQGRDANFENKTGLVYSSRFRLGLLTFLSISHVPPSRLGFPWLCNLFLVGKM